MNINIATSSKRQYFVSIKTEAVAEKKPKVLISQSARHHKKDTARSLTNNGIPAREGSYYYHSSKEKAAKYTLSGISQLRSGPFT